MNGKKTETKTIRLSENILGYIDEQPGNNFSQKFTSMVLFCKEEEKRVKKACDYQVECKDRKLKQLEKELNEIEKKSKISVQLSINYIGFRKI